MNKEQQRIAIAEACGWTVERDSEGYWRARDGIGNYTFELWISESNVWSVGLPDYLNDLNAMHEAEKVLTNQQKEKYLDILSDFTEGRRDTSYVWHDTVFATAAQRAEAFLKTLNLWKP